jgi:hypothetical protein
MTPAAMARLFSQIWGLFDSPVDGEALAAFQKWRSLKLQMGWPSAGDLLRKLESVVTPEQLEAAERKAAQLEQVVDERETEIAALRRVDAARAAQIASLRSALWFSINWPGVVAFGMMLALGYGGWRWWNAEAAPDQQPVAKTTLDASFSDVLSRSKWSEGDTAPIAIMLDGTPYWVVVRGTLDAKSHSDAWGHPISRHCVSLYAHEAVQDAGAFITPRPYLAFGVWLKWSQRAAECRIQGKANY